MKHSFVWDVTISELKETIKRLEEGNPVIAIEIEKNVELIIRNIDFLKEYFSKDYFKEEK